MKIKSDSTQSTKRVGVWIRVSTEDQAAGESPLHHEERARHYADSKGWKVVEIYHLEAVSGKAVMEHPEAKRMLKDVKRGHITGLVFSKLARLARNTKELLEFADYFKAHGADLISLQEAIDTSTPAGRFFYTMMAALAHWEREEIASRVAASLPVRAKLGKCLGGFAPFGYQWKEGKLVPHPDDAPIRKLIHELFLTHKRVQTVCRVINEAGHRTRKGKPFHPASVKKMLLDPTPKGTHPANHITWDNSKKTWIYKPETEWVMQEVEPIVSADVWDACASMLNDPNGKRKSPAKHPVYLFAGLIYCHCGQKMYVKSNSPKYVCSKCHTKIPVTDMENIFIEQIKEYMLSPTELTNYLESKDKDLQTKQELLDAVVGKVKSLRAEMDKVYTLYMSDQITADGFGQRYKPMEAQLAQLQDQMPKLQATVDFLKVGMLSRNQILTEAHDLASFWPDMSPESKRQVVETLVEKITIGKDDIEIDLCYLPAIHQQASPADDDENDNNDPSDDNNDPGVEHPVISSNTSKADAFAKNMAKRSPALAVWTTPPFQGEDTPAQTRNPTR